jgi:hypothetical protein
MAIGIEPPNRKKGKGLRAGKVQQRHDEDDACSLLFDPRLVAANPRAYDKWSKS